MPNTGAVKWRKADDSGDLGMALNAQNHLALDAIVDFASGQTFGSFYYPDATVTSKGIVSIDAAGGLAVDSGVLSLAASGVTVGAYSKVTVDAKGRVTAGANLTASDVPSHSHVATDIVSGELPFKIQQDGTDVGTRRALSLIEGSRVTISATDDPPNDRVSVIITAAPPVSGEITNALGFVPANRAGENFTAQSTVGPTRRSAAPSRTWRSTRKTSACHLGQERRHVHGDCGCRSCARWQPDRGHDDRERRRRTHLGRTSPDW